MAVEILGRGMKDEIRAQREWLRGHRGGCGGIHRENGAGGVGSTRGARNVDHVPGRIERRLDPDKIGPSLLQRGLQGAIRAGSKSVSVMRPSDSSRFSQSRVP